MKDAIFKCRVEELPFLGNIVLESFLRDKSEFIAFSPDYKDPFVTNYQAQVKTVDNLVAPKTLIAEQKQITLRLKSHFTRGRNLMNKLERYVQKAEKTDGLKLTIALDDFGFKAVRQNMNLKNDEGAVLHLKAVKQNFINNLAVLEGKGYTAAVQAELEALISDIANDSLAQTKKMKEREKLVADNIEQLNKLWLMIDDLLKTGKSILKEEDKSRSKDYTYSDLIKNVRMIRAKLEPETTKD